MGYIYLIHMEGTNNYKIGITKRDIQSRINEYKTGNPNQLKIASYYKSQFYQKIETWFHRKYKYIREEGEWFIFNEDIVNKFINECKIIENNIIALQDNPFFN